MKGAGSWAIEGLAGGTLLSARASGFVIFWDWESGEVVRRVEVEATGVSYPSLLRSPRLLMRMDVCRSIGRVAET